MAQRNIHSLLQVQSEGCQSLCSFDRYARGQTQLPQFRSMTGTRCSGATNMGFGEDNGMARCPQSYRSAFFAEKSLPCFAEAKPSPDTDEKPQQNYESPPGFIQTGHHIKPLSGQFDNCEPVCTYTVPTIMASAPGVVDSSAFAGRNLQHVSGVDIRYYQNIRYEDWQRSYLEIEAPSASQSPDSSGPLTPGASGGDGDILVGSFLNQTLFPMNDPRHGHSLSRTLSDGGQSSERKPLASAGEAIRTEPSCSCLLPAGLLGPGPLSIQPPVGPQFAFRPPSITINQPLTRDPYGAAHGLAFTAPASSASRLTASDIHNGPMLQSAVPMLVERTILDSTSSPESSSEPEGHVPNADHSTPVHSAHPKSSDVILFELRAQGYSYRDIKRIGGFREAESTLRGRMRVLTKHRSERVRRPEWKRYDIALLHQGVADMADVRIDGYGRVQEVTGRIPWQRVAKWVKAKGGSYLFSAATCAKKWREETGWSR